MKSIGTIFHEGYLTEHRKHNTISFKPFADLKRSEQMSLLAGAHAVLLHALEALDRAGVTPAEALAGLRAGKTLEEMCVKRERFGWQTGDKVERITAGEPSRATLGARDDGYDRFELLPRVGNEPHWADGWWLNANYKRIEPEPAVLIIDSAAEADRKIAAMEAEPMSSK